MSRNPSVSDEENQLGYQASPQQGTPAKTPKILEKNGLDKAELLRDLTKAAQIDLWNQDDGGNSTLNIATLQRLILFQLQQKIIEKAAPVAKTEVVGANNPLEDQELKTAIADYVRGVRNWEIMKAYSERADGDPTRDPFCISSKWALTLKVMKNAGLVSDRSPYFAGTLDHNIGIFKQRNQENRERSLKDFTTRFIMALVGGVALIGPVLLMVLHNDRTTNLTTVSVATFIVAAIMSKYSKAAPEVMIGTIAAYTAVLVVFLGTQS